MLFRRCSAIVLAAVILLCSSSAFAEKPLTNGDVVKLSKLGLGDEAVVAKVRQAKEVDFLLETDDLAKLKAAGVSSKVIAAMLDRTAGSTVSVVSTPGGSVAVSTGPPATVNLILDGKAIPLTSTLGDPSSTYVYVTMLFWMNFPGLHATVRTTEKMPVVKISADRDPRSRYHVVRLDVNDKGNDRSLKMGRSGAFSFRSGTTPDSDWTFAFDSVEEKRGVWRVSLKKPLPPGEYGVYAVETHELYDFGVD